MPRTKMSKNSAAKRNRDSTHEERVNNCLIDFETLGMFTVLVINTKIRLCFPFLK